MDDFFLYNHIKQAIKERKKIQKNTQSGNFAQNYCRRELMKKKINFNPISHQNAAIKKMKLLMKNFQHLETYVDLNQLLYSINMIKAKEEEQKRINNVHEKQRISRISRLNNLQQGIKSMFSRFHEGKIQNSLGLDPIKVLKKKFKGQINEMMIRKYQNQNSQIESLVNHLEKNTLVYNSLLKNNSNDYLSYLNDSLQKIQKDEDFVASSQKNKEEIFKYLTQAISQPKQDKKNQKDFYRSTSLNSRRKKQQNQLLHKIATFLQIALQNQHKEKWATKQVKKFRSSHGSFRFKKGKLQRSIFFLQSIQNKKSNFSFSKSSLSKGNAFIKNSDQKIKENSFSKINSIKTLPQNKKPYCQKINLQESLLNNENEKSHMRKSASSKRQNSFQTHNQFCHKQKENNPSFVNLCKNEDVKLQQPGSKRFKNRYLVQKGRKNYQYKFIKPQRENIHYKTVIVKPNDNFSNNMSSMNEGNQIELINQDSLQLNSILMNTSQSQKFDLSQSMNREQKRSFVCNFKDDLSKTKKKLSKKSVISEQFTFKRRGKKQLILNKLGRFIEGVTNEEKASRVENQYYDMAINRLQELSLTSFKQYEPQALAGMQEISELKKFVGSINPLSKRSNSRKTVGKRDGK